MVTVQSREVVMLLSCTFQLTLTFVSHVNMTSPEASSNEFNKSTMTRSLIEGMKENNSRLKVKGDYVNGLFEIQERPSLLATKWRRDVQSFFQLLPIKEYHQKTTTPFNTQNTPYNTQHTTYKTQHTTYAMEITSHDVSEEAWRNVSEMSSGDRSKITSDTQIKMPSEDRSKIPSDNRSKMPFEEKLLRGVFTGCITALFCQFQRCPNVQFRNEATFDEDMRLVDDLMRGTTEYSSTPIPVTNSVSPTVAMPTSSRQFFPITDGTPVLQDGTPAPHDIESLISSSTSQPKEGLEDFDIEFLNKVTTVTNPHAPADSSCAADRLLGKLCSCDIDCVRYGDCCVDTFYSCHRLNTTDDVIHFLREKSEKSDSKNTRVSFPDSSSSALSFDDEMLIRYGACVMVGRNPEQHVLMVGACPDMDVTDSATREKCHTSDHVLLPPVTGDIHGSRIPFKNVFCALCHGVNTGHLIAWSAEIHCDDVFSDEDVTAMPEADVIRNVNDGFCNVTYQHRNLTCQPRYCQPDARLTDVQRSQLTHSVKSGVCSADDEALCMAYYFPDSGYKNPHCKRCLALQTTHRKKRQMEAYKKCEVPFPPQISGGILVILDLFGRYSGSGDNQLATFNLCGDSQVYDPLEETCRTLLCRNGFKPHQGHCVVDPASVTDSELSLFPKTWRFLKFSIDVTKILNLSCEKMEQDLKTTEFWSGVNISLTLAPGSGREQGTETDVIERQCVDYTSSKLLHLSVVSIKFLIELKPTVDVSKVALIQAISHLLMTYLAPNQITQIRATNMIQDLMVHCPEHTRLTKYTDVSLTFNNKTTYATINISNPPSYHPFSGVGFEVSIYDLEPEGKLALEAVYVCSDDLFNETCSIVSYSVNETTFNATHLMILHTKQIYARDKFTVQAGTILVCSDFNFAIRTTVNSGDLVYRLLNWTMTSLACLFLLAMVVLYCAFPELATLPGKMTASLAGTMMLTFLFNLLTLVDVHNTYICLVVAVVSHTVTLAHFGWMAAIALNMALTFGSRAMTSTGQQNTFLLYNVAVWGSSVAIVVTSVSLDLSHRDAAAAASEPSYDTSYNESLSDISHVPTTSSEYPRYGYPICSWFSGAMWTRLAFVIIPFALTYLNNIVCFTITLTGIHKASQNSAKVGKKRSDLTRCLIYFKLSTAMGFSWILSLLINFAPEEEALPYLFVVLVFLQGVMLFMAFMANSRVYNVVTSRISLRTSSWRTTTKSRVVSSVYSNRV